MSDASQCLEFLFCQLRRQCAEIPKYAVSAEREAGVARIANGAGLGGKRKAQETSQGEMSQGSHLGLVAGAVVA